LDEARVFNFTYRYIDDVLSINNSRFAEFLPLIYPPELEVKETTDTVSSASFLDLYLEFDDSGQLREIRIIATGPCIANQLRDVNTICRRSWYIAAHVWMRLESLISHTGILMTFYLSIILDLQNFFH
jgi:hypothetical protein